MTTLTCIAEPDHPITLIRAVGLLTYGSAPLLREAAGKALTDHPDLLLIDVSGVEVLDDMTLTVFPALASQAAEREVSVMLVGPSPTLAGHLESLAIGRRLPVFASRAEAEAAHDRRPGPRRISADLPDEPAATHLARAFVDRTCARWRIRPLADHAALVATELVANAVQHARTAAVISLALRQHYLHLSVRDGSHERPRRSPEGHGLLIVEALAASWGCVQTTDGKAMWATLRLPGAR
ncbi:STAS domain-containing protein [Dactylosporangium sp. AC04546]|uniref:STAS domain-containing protein n=1 Tax=Dactylosporangium sp. AC04546 TaxID=2862460 RepID=UPI001EE0B02C|nr:STAS domain-containing protein [Dactylosporangium sp. AC04546]WVK81861.1 STAS domain-containing protein [Dactylosporangium sp. AC04546]